MRLLFSLIVAMVLASELLAQSIDPTIHTPWGAPLTGSDDGRVASWEGGLTAPPAEHIPGRHRTDPFSDDAPIDTITAANLATYAEQLTPGLKAILETYPESFSIPIYPSRRSHAAPEQVYAAIADNLDTARLSEDGNGFTGARIGIPFAFPNNGLEAYFNHVARWRGEQIRVRAADANVQADGDYQLVARDTAIRFDYALTDGEDNVLFSLMSQTTSPAKLAGGGALVIETINQDAEPRSAWIYDQGRRRALRAPQLGFDMVANSADGLRTADDADIINGSPSRFNWELKGKQVVLVPYNVYAVNQAGVDYDDLIMPGHLNPKYLRFEWHRVWVVEATVKTEWRHTYPRRVFYFDEDSWLALMADQYDANDQLWRVSLALPINDYELPGVNPSLYVFHDLHSHRYHIQGLRGAYDRAADISPDALKGVTFNPAGLRRFVR